MRKIYGVKAKEQNTGEKCVRTTFMICFLHNVIKDKIKEDEINVVCTWEKENA
jgi:hypothetical protein